MKAPQGNSNSKCFLHILLDLVFENPKFCLKKRSETQLNIKKLCYIVTGR